MFCSAGARISQLQWLQSGDAYDIAIAYYGDDNVSAPPGVTYFFSNKDYKIPNFLEALRRFPSLLEYELYLFLDDDLILDEQVIRAWISTVEDQNLDVSSISFAHDSKIDFPHLRQQKGLGVDQSQLLEVGCFALRRSALRLVLPFFFMAKTGTGINLALYKLCERHGLTSGVIHSLTVLHPHRPEVATVREQFKEFDRYNQHLSRLIYFCFDENELLTNLSAASRIFGSTHPGFVRLCAVGRYLLRRAARVISKMGGKSNGGPRHGSP